MTRKEANADIQVDGDARATPTRKRLAEGDIVVENLPGIEASPGQTFELTCQTQGELQELLVAIEEGDEETVQKYVKEGD